MKNIRISTVIVILVILTGLSLLLYPTVANYINSLSYRRMIVDYQTEVQDMDDETYEALLKEAREYNERRAARGPSLMHLSEEDWKEYESILDITGTGIMGYVEIPKLDISLPIYHGTSEEVLQSGIGHLEGSSLPVGGKNTHAVISGHRGLPSSQLFTTIDQLNPGDIFFIHVLNEVLTYEVDQSVTVLPGEFDELKIKEGKDYCTLLTCTPYGVNTHRLLVRGHRIPTPEKVLEEAQETMKKAHWLHMLEMITIGVGIILIILIMIYLIIRRNHNNKKK